MQIVPSLSKLSYFMRCCLHVAAKLVGVRKDPKQWRFDGLVTAGWVFLLGMPIGAMILGAAFNLALWAIVVVAATAIVNADDALHLVLWLKENNLDGEVKNATVSSGC
jgi:hypothetical protein